MMKFQSAGSKRKTVRWASVVLVGALAGCGGGSTEPTNAGSTAAGAERGSATTSDPAATDESLRARGIAAGVVSSRKACELLTQADAEAAVGQPLPKHSENVTLGMCTYTADDFSAGAELTVGDWESIKAAATSGTPAPDSIPGVGDEALNLNGRNGSHLYVRKGDEGFLLTLNGPKIDPLPDHGLAAEKDLALKILGRF